MAKDERDTGSKKRGDRVTAKGYDQLLPEDEQKTPVQPPSETLQAKSAAGTPRAAGAVPAGKPRAPLPGDPHGKIVTQAAPLKEDTTVDEDLVKGAAEGTAVTLPPFVEVELVYERGPQVAENQGWRALEVWTRNRIYGVDWSMSCIEVIDRENGQPDPKHPLLGARLAGGQAREDGNMELTYPCPRPGCEAVFEHKSKRGSFSHTSTVLRVVLRLRVVTVVPESANVRWTELTGAHKLPR